jgi:asparagine N-glycosylation enzyme membrane subunit Stt3
MMSEKISKETIKNGLKGLANFFKGKQLLVLLLIPMLLVVCVRILPYFTPMTETWAKNAVENGIKNQISAEIQKQFPHLPQDTLDKEIQNNYDKLDKTQLKDQIAQVKKYFDDKLRDDKGTPYLEGIDPYQHYRRALNLLDHGTVGEAYTGNGAINGVKNGTFWDAYRNAPFGKAITPDLHVYVGAYLYLAIKVFFHNIDFMQVFYFYHLIFAALSVIPIFFIVRKFGGNLGGFFAGIIFAVQKIFVMRTVAGFSDTDVYPTFFMLFIVWFMLEAIETKSKLKCIFFGALSGIFLGLFSFVWNGWWFTLYMILIGFIGYLGILAVIDLYKKRTIQTIISHLKPIFVSMLISGLAFFFLSMVTSYALYGSFIEWIRFIIGPGEFLHLKDIATTSLFPNINVTIAEMGALKLGDIISQLIPWVFWISFIGIFFTLLNHNKKLNFEQRLKYTVILGIWWFATMFASFKGNRFVMMVIPPLSITFGICVGIIIEKVSEFGKRHISLPKLLTTVLLFAIGCVLMVTPIKDCIDLSKQAVSNVDDSWQNALTNIDLKGSPDAIINSWWDFGHYYAAIGNRRVTFDGSHQVPYGAFWVGHALYTSNESLSVGILRMLDCGANTAEINLNKYLGYTIDGNPKTIDILMQILPIPHTEHELAEKTLSELAPMLTDTQIEDVLSYTHCDPPENFFITSTDMIPKAAVWGHFGMWDFNKAQIYNAIDGKSESERMSILQSDKFNFSKDAAIKIVDSLRTIESNDKVEYPGDRWIAPYPGYYSNPTSCKQENMTLTCGNGPIIDLATMDAKIVAQNQVAIPKRITYFDNGTFVSKEFTTDMDIEVMLLNKDGNYAAMLSAGDLAPSIFTRLHIYGGEGLKQFKLFSYDKTLTNEEIYVWRVDWTGGGYFGTGTWEVK